MPTCRIPGSQIELKLGLSAMNPSMGKHANLQPDQGQSTPLIWQALTGLNEKIPYFGAIPVACGRSMDAID